MRLPEACRKRCALWFHCRRAGIYGAPPGVSLPDTTPTPNDMEDMASCVRDQAPMVATTDHISAEVAEWGMFDEAFGAGKAVPGENYGDTASETSEYNSGDESGCATSDSRPRWTSPLVGRNYLFRKTLGLICICSICSHG